MVNCSTILWCKAISGSLGLAFGAEVRAAVTDGDALDGVTADRAGLATKAVGDLKLEMGGAQRAIGAEVGINAGTFIANS